MATPVIDDTTLGPNTGDAVAYTGHTLATASCQVDFGEYTSLLNVAMHDSVEVEAVLKIETDLKTLATVFAHADPSTYYQYVHRDEKFGTAFTDDEAGLLALKTHNEALSAAYGGALDDTDTEATFFSRFRRRLTGDSGGLESYASKIIEYIMARMFSPDASVAGLPKAYLRTDIFSVDRVQSQILSDGKIDMLSECAFRNWLDPSKINEDSEFIATHRSSQDNSVLGYSVNADGINDQDMLVLNIKFTPDQIAGFVSEDRTLRVEFVHDSDRIVVPGTGAAATHRVYLIESDTDTTIGQQSRHYTAIGMQDIETLENIPPGSYGTFHPENYRLFINDIERAYSITTNGILPQDENGDAVPQSDWGIQIHDVVKFVSRLDDVVVDTQSWSFANQVVFTATGGASDEVAGLGLDGDGGANVPSSA